MPIVNGHVTRVLADGGVIPNIKLLEETVKFMLSGNRGLADYAIAVDPEIFGYKIGAASNTVSKLYSLIQDSDVSQSTGGSQPIVMPWTSGNNYWTSVGVVSSNFISTPDAVANRITGDIDIIAKINLITDNASLKVIAAKFNVAGSRSWSFGTFSSKLRFTVTIDGTTSVNYDSSTTIGLGVGYVRVKRNSTTGDSTFYTSTDGSTWSQLGAVITGTTGAIFNSATVVAIGATSAGTSLINYNYIHSVKVYNGFSDAGGTLAVSFDANDYRRVDSTNQTTFTSSLTGEVYTINIGTASTGYKGVLVDRTRIQTDRVDDRVTGTFSWIQPHTNYVVFNTFNTSSSASDIYDGIGTSNRGTLALVNAVLTVQNGGTGASFSPFTFNKRHVVAGVHNGVNSRISMDNSTSVTGDVGTSNPAGITIGSRWDSVSFANMNFSTLIGTKTSDDSKRVAEIVNFINLRLHKKLY